MAGCGEKNGSIKIDGSGEASESDTASKATRLENIDPLQIETEHPEQIENSASNESNDTPETEFTGRYVDDLGTGYEKSEMIITKDDNGIFLVDFGVYKLFYVTAALGRYHSETNTLNFEGTDDTGSEIAASISSEGNYLSVTIIKSPYWDVSKGTILKYYPEGYYSVEDK